MTISTKLPVAFGKLLLLFFLALPVQILAGVGNPNLSVIGDMFVEMNGDPGDPDTDRPRIGLNGAELMFDDYLNPFARGTVIIHAHSDAIELEEAYFEIVRGIPLGFGLKAGKARTDFGRLNAIHPHTYPFIETPSLLKAYTRSDEGMNDLEIRLSKLFALPGDVASTLSFAVLQGNSFRGGHHHSHEGEEAEAEEEEGADQTRLGWSFRWKNFMTFGEKNLLEVGLSAAQGINDPHEGTATKLLGVDFKSKIYASAQNYLTLQGEFIRPSVEHFHEDEGEIETLEPTGFWVSADYTLRSRFYFGARFESFEHLEDDLPGSTRIGGYAGFAPLEESTLFRLLAERIENEQVKAYNRFLLQAIFSMGPHKPHQF